MNSMDRGYVPNYNDNVDNHQNTTIRNNCEITRSYDDVLVTENDKLSSNEPSTAGSTSVIVENDNYEKNIFFIDVGDKLKEVKRSEREPTISPNSMDSSPNHSFNSNLAVPMNGSVEVEPNNNQQHESSEMNDMRHRPRLRLNINLAMENNLQSIANHWQIETSKQLNRNTTSIQSNFTGRQVNHSISQERVVRENTLSQQENRTSSLGSAFLQSNQTERDIIHRMPNSSQYSMLRQILTRTQPRIYLNPSSPEYQINTLLSDVHDETINLEATNMLEPNEFVITANNTESGVLNTPIIEFNESQLYRRPNIDVNIIRTPALQSSNTNKMMALNQSSSDADDRSSNNSDNSRTTNNNLQVEFNTDFNNDDSTNSNTITYETTTRSDNNRRLVIEKILDVKRTEEGRLVYNVKWFGSERIGTVDGSEVSDSFNFIEFWKNWGDKPIDIIYGANTCENDYSNEFNFNLSNWVSIKNVLNAIEPFRRCLSHSGIEIVEFFDRLDYNCDKIYLLSHTSHIYVILHLYIKKLIYISDGTNLFMTDDETRKEVEEKILSGYHDDNNYRFITMKNDLQVRADYCGSTAGSVALEFARLYRTKLLPYTDGYISTNETIRSRLRKKLHPAKSERLKFQSPFKRERLRCDICDKGFKFDKRIFALHMRKHRNEK